MRFGIFVSLARLYRVDYSTLTLWTDRVLPDTYFDSFDPKNMFKSFRKLGERVLSEAYIIKIQNYFHRSLAL